MGAPRGLATAPHLPGGEQCDWASREARWGLVLLGRRNVGGLDDLAGAQTARADVDPLDAAANDSADPLDIRVPTTLRADVGVADTHAERRLFVADLTYRGHSDSFEKTGEDRTAPSGGVLLATNVRTNNVR